MNRFNEDKVDDTVKDLVNMEYDNGTVILILTGQRERSRRITVDWLKANGVKFNFLVMKPDDDTRDTKIWKRDKFVETLSIVYNIKYILEDREDTVDMWREMRVRCFQTASGQDREYYSQKRNDIVNEQIN